MNRCLAEGRERLRKLMSEGGEIVSADPLEGVDILRPIVFLDALIRLQTMLGRHVKVELNDNGCFFGCGFEGKLEKVETMPSSKSAISAFVGGGGGFFLDPDDCQAYVVDAGQDGRRLR